MIGTQRTPPNPHKVLQAAAKAASITAAIRSAIKKPASRISVIAIGSSTGGTEALSQVLPALRPPLPPVLVVQHIPAGFSNLFANRLNGECPLTVKEAANNDIVRPNSIYIAPGNLHMSIKKLGDVIKINCLMGPKLHGCRPAVDVLFKSVAKYFTEGSALGVILTGIGRDGTAGLIEMKKNGSPTIGQDEATSVVYGMPKAAFDAGVIDRQLPLNLIAAAIMNRVKTSDF